MRSSPKGRVYWSMLVASSAVAILSGCGGGDEPPTMPTASAAALSQSLVSIAAGAPSVSTTLSIRSTGSVALSARAAEGIFVIFSPAVIPAGSGTSSISVGISTTVPAGTYPVVIFAARSAGVTDSVTLTVTVVGSPVTGTAVTLDYCAADAPIWLAVRDGSGFWTRIAPNSGSNTYQFRITTPLGFVSVASVDTVGTGYHLRVISARDVEMAGINAALGLGQCESGTVSGTVANAGTPTTATVALAHSWRFLDGVSSNAFTLSAVAAPPQDLIATRVDPQTRAANMLILRRGLAAGAGGAIPVLDFDASEAFVPGRGSVTLSGLGGDSAVVATAFRGTRGRANGQIGLPAVYPADAGTVPFFAIPLGQMGANELQQLTVTASEANAPTSSRSTTVFFRAPGAVTVSLGAVLPPPLVTRLPAGPYARARVQFAVENPYGRYATAAFTQSAASRAVTILATPGIPVIIGSLGTWDFSIPDLADAAGWNNAWGPINGAPIAWSVTAAGGQNFRLGTTVQDGAVLRTATRSGVLPIQ